MASASGSSDNALQLAPVEGGAHRAPSIVMPLALWSSRVASTRRADDHPPPIQETELDRVLKLIPTEVIALYTAAVPAAADVSWAGLMLVLFIGCIVLITVVLYFDGRNTGQPARWPQYLARCVVFTAWSNAISPPFQSWISAPRLDWLRSLAVLAVPLVAAMFLRDRPGGDRLSGHWQ